MSKYFYTGIDFTAGLMVLSSEFLREPVSFVMRRSSGPVHFWDIHKVYFRKLVEVS